MILVTKTSDLARQRGHTLSTCIILCVCVCVCVYVCVFSSHLFWESSSLDVPAGVTKEEGHRISHPP